MLGEQIFRVNQAKYFILNTNEIVTVSLKYRFWVRAWHKRESLYFTLTRVVEGKLLGSYFVKERKPLFSLTISAQRFRVLCSNTTAMGRFRGFIKRIYFS